MNPEPSMRVSVGMDGRDDSPARAGPQRESRRRRRSVQRAPELLGAEEELVAVHDAAALHALAAVPGPVGRAEVLDPPPLRVADEGGVLAGDLGAVDDEVAVTAAADDEPV